MNNDEVIVRFDGRMGNQMFQWAFARAYEAKNGIMPIFDDSYETLKLQPFNLIKQIKTVKKPFFNKVLRKIIPFHNLRNRVTELSFDMPKPKEEIHYKYYPELLEQKAPVYFHGYFQSEKYFKDLRETLKEDFQLIFKLNDKNKKMLEKINNTESVSVHFRRGDCLKARVANRRGNCNNDYIFDAIEYISQNTDKPLTLFVFSDDIKWVKNNIKFEQDTIYVDINSDKKGWFDLELMKNCKHNIIVNSSFSWWGAWLNENPDKIVVAPNPYGKYYNFNSYDVVPESWHKCEVNWNEN